MQEQKELASLFGGLQAGLNALREVRTIYDERVAFAFNSINFFEPNENKTSEILAFFLDPQKEHGQKDVFLKAFLQYFKLNRPLELLLRGSKPIARREHRTDTNRRVDITVEFGDREYIVGIENKIWAADQKNQVSDYTKYFETHFGTDAYTLLFLTPDGREPGDGSIVEPERKILMENGKLRILSYEQDIVELLSQFELVCKAENVRAFIRDLRQYLKQQYRGETIMGETDFVAKYVSDDRNRLELAFDVLNAADCIRQAAWDRFRVELEKYCDVHAMDLVEVAAQIDDFRGEKWCRAFRLRPQQWVPKQTIWVEFDGLNGSRSEIVVGGFPTLVMSELAKLAQLTGPNRDGNAYCGLKYYHLAWHSASEPWRDMVVMEENGWSRFMNHVDEWVRRIISAAKEAERATAHGLGGE